MSEHRTDSNHRRTGLCPTPSSTESTMLFICFVRYVRYHIVESHAYWRILLSVSSRAANYAPHKTIMLHGELSATSPAHHRMAINHLLHRLIYNALLRTRCHTEGKVWLLLKELWTLLSALFFIRVSRVLDFSKCGQVGHEPTGMHYLFELKTSPCLP